jgi:hypothetical protein
MKFGLQLVTGPVVEPVTLDAAKLHLRVDYPNDDALISSLIVAARETVEGQLNRIIFEQTWVLTLDQFPYPVSVRTIAPGTRDAFFGAGLYFDWTAINLPLPRLTSITSITYLDEAGQPQTLDPSTYVVDSVSEPARIVPAKGGSWPYPSCYTPGSVKITFLTGTYGDGVTKNLCPRSICQAVLLLIGHWYANREAASPTSMTTLPLAVDMLLSKHKFFSLAV